jgi:hypothetical protein
MDSNTIGLILLIIIALGLICLIASSKNKNAKYEEITNEL